MAWPPRGSRVGTAADAGRRRARPALLGPALAASPSAPAVRQAAGDSGGTGAPFLLVRAQRDHLCLPSPCSQRWQGTPPATQERQLDSRVEYSSSSSCSRVQTGRGSNQARVCLPVRLWDTRPRPAPYHRASAVALFTPKASRKDSRLRTHHRRLDDAARSGTEALGEAGAQLGRVGENGVQLPASQHVSQVG